MKNRVYFIFIFIIATVINTHLFAQIPTENLILHLTFNDSSIIDHSTFNHTVIDHSTNFGEGINSTSLSLTGTENEYLEVPHTPALSIDEKITMSFWYNHQQQPTSSFYSLVEQSANEFGGHSRYGTWILNNTDLWLCIEPDVCPGGTTLCQRCLSSTIPFEVDQWYHIVGTYDGSRLKLYLNGELNKEQSYDISTGISVRQFPLTIGTDIYDNAPVFLKGLLDEIRIYDTDLTSNQVVALYEEFLPTAIQENDIKQDFLIYPNPSSDLISIKGIDTFYKINIINSQGITLKEWQVLADHKVNISNLPTGYYFIQIWSDEHFYSKPFYVNKN